MVTGGGTGIGLAIARALASEGCQVAIAGRREEPLREATAAWSGEPWCILSRCTSTLMPRSLTSACGRGRLGTPPREVLIW